MLGPLLLECKIPCVQELLHSRKADGENELSLRWQRRSEDALVAALHKLLKNVVEHERPLAHQFDVLLLAILALAVEDRVDKSVVELGQRPQVHGPDKIDHAPIFFQVVLQRISGEDDPPECLDILECLGHRSILVFDAVAFVADDNVGPRVTERVAYVIHHIGHCFFIFQINHLLLSLGAPFLHLSLMPLLGGCTHHPEHLVADQQNTAGFPIKPIMNDRVPFFKCF